MAKLKYKKLPKKPKQSAGNATKEAYLKRVAEVRSYNQNVDRENKKAKQLSDKIRKISAADVRPGSRSGFSAPRKKSSGKKKAAKKSGKRKR